MASLLRLTRRLGGRSSCRVAPLPDVLAAWRGRRGSFPVATLPFRWAVATVLPIRPTRHSTGRQGSVVAYPAAPRPAPVNSNVGRLDPAVHRPGPTREVLVAEFHAASIQRDGVPRVQRQPHGEMLQPVPLEARFELMIARRIAGWRASGPRSSSVADSGAAGVQCCASWRLNRTWELRRSTGKPKMKNIGVH